jgi:hypothetical protein
LYSPPAQREQLLAASPAGPKLDPVFIGMKSMGRLDRVFFARNQVKRRTRKPLERLMLHGGDTLGRTGRMQGKHPLCIGLVQSRTASFARTRISPAASAWVLLILMASLSWVGGGGCISSLLNRGSSPPSEEPSSPASAGPSEGGTGRGSPVFARQLQRLAVEFKVHRFSAPSGTFSSDHADIWKLVTGPLPDAAATFRLTDNGFRAVVGRESDRAPLRGWLDELEGVRSALDTAVPDAAHSVDVEIGACLPRQTVFFFDRQGLLHGLDFVDAKARFRMSFEMRSANLHEVWLEVVPEIEEPPGPPKWVITQQGAKQEPEERRHTFSELTFAAQIPEGGFLLLGPTTAVRHRPLLGSPFFLEQTGVAEKAGAGQDASDIRESIYVISPIIRSQTPGQPPVRERSNPA